MASDNPKDLEIDQIMSEIDRLQEEEQEPSSTPGSTLQDFHRSSDDAAMEDVLADLKEETPAETEGKVLKANFGATKTMDHLEDGEGSLTLSLSGKMKLKLQYEQDGQSVSLCFVDDALMVSLSDGTEFKIPVNRGRGDKKSA